MESIDGLAVAAIEEAKELVEESVEAFKNGNVKKMMAFAFYALPHKMKEKDKKRLAELIDAKLGWEVPFRMRFTNKMSRTGYVIFEDKFYLFYLYNKQFIATPKPDWPLFRSRHWVPSW